MFNFPECLCKTKRGSQKQTSLFIKQSAQKNWEIVHVTVNFALLGLQTLKTKNRFCQWSKNLHSDNKLKVDKTF